MNTIPPTSSLIQTKPDKQTSLSASSPAEDDSTSVQPVAPTEPLGALSQETDTDRRLTASPPTDQPGAPPEEASLAVQTLNSFMQTMKRDLEFEFDPELDRTIVTVRDANTQEVVRKLPSEAAIKLAKVLQDSKAQQDGPVGQLLDVKT